MEHPPSDAARFDPAAGEVEEVDALPVLSEAGPLERRRVVGQVVARQAAAVAATSFAAGIATVAVARVAKGRRARRRSRRSMGHVVVSRSFLVDVHLLGPRD
ncbi:MAG: hypothetical protein QOD55_219 [Solirubrobacteraceae bacterium]|jgi:hypothetical protein|nr:hypothetical protein [Solirubrobacteraceae bacterium]